MPKSDNVMYQWPKGVKDDTNPIFDALEIAQEMMDSILEQSGEILESKVALSIGAGLAAAGMARYFMQHPEIIETALKQIGESLEIGAGMAAQGGASTEGILTALAALVGGGAVATAIPGVPPPP